MAVSSIPQSNPAEAFSSAFNSSFDQARSLAQRQAEMAQNQSKFDIIQNLRQQQFDQQKQTSLAQIAAINADTQVKTIQAQEAQRQYDQYPLQQQAGVDFQNVISDAVSKAQTPQEFDSLVQQGTANNPDIIKNFQGGITGYNNAVLQAKSGFMGTALQQMQVKKQLADQQTVFDAQSLGLDPEDFRQATPDGSQGPIDLGALRSAVNDAQIQKTQQVEKFKSDLESQRQQENIRMRNQGALDVVNRRLQSNEANITDRDKRAQYHEANMNARAAYAAMNKATPGSDEYNTAQDEYQKYLAQADGIYSGSTGKDSGLTDYIQNFLDNTKPSQVNVSATPDAPIAINKLTGKKLQLINGQWQPIP